MIIDMQNNSEVASASTSRLKQTLVKPVLEDVLDAQEIIENPVVTTSKYAYETTNVVQISDKGVTRAAKYIRQKMLQEEYTPRTWRTHPLHICPDDNADPYDSSDSIPPTGDATAVDRISGNRNKLVLDWIFLISSLNFSFWSEEGTDDRFGIDWVEGWEALDTEGEDAERVAHTGYWSLVAALDRALQENIPICEPQFYSSEILCPDTLIEHIFRPSAFSIEKIPLLKERVEIMRENGRILCENFGGSFQNLLIHFQKLHRGQGSALQLVQMVTRTFPKFRDEFVLDGRQIYIWKRAQILVAEIWAAFYPSSSSPSPHPIFPSCPSPSSALSPKPTTRDGPRIRQLTMFADYRVPQILHHLRILTYPQYLTDMLTNGVTLPSGSREEISLRAASVVSVERVREEIERIMCEEKEKDVRSRSEEEKAGEGGEINSVLIDFYLWDLAKEIEEGKKQVEGIETEEIIPTHRTRSIWY